MAAQEAAAITAALGQWSTRQQAGAKIGVDFFNLGSSSPSGSSNRERNHHYTFDVDDNGLDINGFILHTDKHKGKRHKFRVYLDSNENNRFDKNDELIGRTGLKQKHAAKGVGNLLDEGEIGQLEVQFKTTNNAKLRNAETALMKEQEPSSGYQIEGQGAINKLGSLGGDGGTAGHVSVTNLSFGDSDDDPVSSFHPRIIIDGGVHFIDIDDSIDHDLFHPSVV